MSASSVTLRTLCFGDVELTTWGVSWTTDDAGPVAAALGAAGDGSFLQELQWSRAQDGGDWRLEGDGAALLVTPAGEAVSVRADADQIDGSEQLCHVSGTFALAGTERVVDCLGVCSSWSGVTPLERFDSIRAVSSWFEPDEALTLTAFRARKARAHDADALAAAVLTPDGCPPVEDPRLSTTYEAGGWPVRAGLELWLAGDGSEQQYPRRASGEAAGARAEITAGELELRAEPFRWHSRGRPGAGMYILARRR